MIRMVHACKQLPSCPRGHGEGGRQGGEQDEMAIDLIWAELIAGVPESHAPRAGGSATADGDAGRSSGR